MANKVEICIFCGSETGRAGQHDDSLYREESGPYCEECFEWSRHLNPNECPTWHDGCNCSPRTCVELYAQLDKADARADLQWAAKLIIDMHNCTDLIAMYTLLGDNWERAVAILDRLNGSE